MELLAKSSLHSLNNQTFGVAGEVSWMYHELWCKEGTVFTSITSWSHHGFFRVVVFGNVFCTPAGQPFTSLGNSVIKIPVEYGNQNFLVSPL